MRSGAFTCFHVMHNSEFDNCIFVQNKCKEQANSISLESVEQKVTIGNCYFDGPKSEQVSMRYDGSYLTILNTNIFDTNINEKHPMAQKIIDQFDTKMFE